MADDVAGHRQREPCLVGRLGVLLGLPPGREPLAEDGDPDEYDDDDNPQYNLIFTPWDAQFDKQRREWRSFVPADVDVRSRYESALERVNALGDVMELRYADDQKAWLDLCKQNLEKWTGEGVRLKPVG